MFRKVVRTDSDRTLTFLRIAVGSVMSVHGAQKVLGIMAAIVVVVLAAVPHAQQALTPARLVRGDLPGLPPPAVGGGGEVLIEAVVDRNGHLVQPLLLRSTPPFTQMVADAIRGWEFTPARAVRPDGTEGPVNSKVLIAALYRAPALFNNPTLGAPAEEVGASKAHSPYPTLMVMPPYPPHARSGSVVLIELTLDEAGNITRTRPVASDPGFDAAAIDTVLQWHFRPAMVEDRPAPSTVYVLFGFSPPVAQ